MMWLMTWQMKCLKKSIGTINVMHQFLNIYIYIYIYDTLGPICHWDISLMRYFLVSSTPYVVYYNPH